MASRNLLPRFLAGLLVAGALAQGKREPPDPSYTRGEAAALAKLGYLSLGPFAWGKDDTDKVGLAFSQIGLIWAETAHFKVGSALRQVAAPNPDGRQGDHRLDRELKRLRDKLPKAPAKPANLDRWLRLHLFAQRLERLWTDFAAGLPDGGKALPDKMAVLLFHSTEDLERYQQTFHGSTSRMPHRYTLEGGVPLFVTAAGAAGDMVSDDAALHVHVVFHVVHNFVESYKGNYYQLPVWFGEGLAHWFARRIDPKRLNWTSQPALPTNMKDLRDWPVKVRQIVEHDMAAPAHELMRWLGYDKLGFDDHVAAWSRVDFLMQRDAKGLGVWLDTLKGVLDGGRAIEGEAVFARQELALKKAWGLDPAQLDQEWRAWVKAKPKR